MSSGRMAKTSVALPADLKDGSEGRADLVPYLERIVLSLTAQKKEGAAYLLTKKLSVFKCECE